MPIFNFSTIQKTKVKSDKREKRNVTLNRMDKSYKKVIKHDIKGIVNINIDGDYFVKDSDMNIYNINLDNFRCKGHEFVYLQDLSKFPKGLIVGRLIENRQNLCEDLYLPFAPGCVVEGNIISTNNSFDKVFDIKRIYRVFDNEQAHIARDFWVKNFDKIKENKLKKLIINNE